MKPVKQKRYRAISARQEPQTEVKQISEEEYLKTLYPHIDYTALDMHCARDHHGEWYGEFAEKVFERSNQMKYDMFIKRCIKTSPYNDNGGEKYNMLKSLSKERSKTALPRLSVVRRCAQAKVPSSSTLFATTRTFSMGWLLASSTKVA